MKDGLNVASLPSPAERYELGTKLGSGIFGAVYKATDTQAAGKSVAIKVQTYTDENETHIQEEYKILRDFTKHPNLIDFYGVFYDKSESARDVWFVLEVSQCYSTADRLIYIAFWDRYRIGLFVFSCANVGLSSILSES